jgi:hypothetical protein
MQAALQHREVISLVNLIAPKVTPDPLKFGHGRPEMLSPRRQHHRVYGARRGPADNREWIGVGFGQRFGQSLENTNLESTARAATREDQGSSYRISLIGHKACSKDYRWLPSSVV